MHYFMVHLLESKQSLPDNAKSLQISHMVFPLGWTETIGYTR